MRITSLFLAMGLALASFSASAAMRYMEQPTARVDFPVQINVVDEGGAPRSVWMRGGEEYVVSSPHAFGLRFYNKSAHAVKVVLGKDGVNVLDGAPWNFDGRGYVIPSGGVLFVDRDSKNAPLHFSPAAEQEGEGMIRWAIFEERTWMEQPRQPMHTVSVEEAAGEEWNNAFRSRSPYQDDMGMFHYDNAYDLQLRGVIPMVVVAAH